MQLEREVQLLADDLGAIIPSDRVRTYAPVLLEKIGALRRLRSPRVGLGGRALDRVLHNFEQAIRRNVDLEAELEMWNETTNVVVSTPMDNVPPATTSCVCTWGAPYSGKDYLVLDCLVPAELTPAGRLVDLSFSSLNFALPSTQISTVQYSSAPGVLGAPLQGGMDLVVFYQNKTSPHGRRHFVPWVGWVFDASAKNTFSIYNPDPVTARSYQISWLCRSSPCAEEFDRTMAFSRHRPSTRGKDFGAVMNAIHSAVIGLGSV